MTRSLFVACLLVGAAMAPAAAAAQQGAPTSPSVSTEGRASAKVAPDVAWITVTAEARAQRTADAQRQNAAAIDAVKSSLRQAGVADEAMKTLSYSVEPQMQYTDGKSKVIGYIARHSISVRVDDLARIGALIDVAGGSGATSISDIRYDVKARADIERRLLTEAVQDGMRRANAMASGAGKEVLTIWRIEESRFSTVPQPMYKVAMARAEAATEISPNEIEIQVQVALTVLLK
ncbi:MAG: DUF541 domain-containing protein [Acidobacteria bacterium]|nr:MAG: DUF541 domain-containing protein [Acidobacteriota bacterium]